MLLEQAEEAKGVAEDDAAASRAAVAEAHAAAQRLLSAQVSCPCNLEIAPSISIGIGSC